MTVFIEIAYKLPETDSGPRDFGEKLVKGLGKQDREAEVN